MSLRHVTAAWCDNKNAEIGDAHRKKEIIIAVKAEAINDSIRETNLKRERWR